LTARLIRTTWPRLASDETPLVDVRILDHSNPGDLARALDPWAPASLEADEPAQLVSLSGLETTSSSPILAFGGHLTEAFEHQSAGFVTQLAALLGRPLAVGPPLDEWREESWQLVGQMAAGKKLVIAVVEADEL